ncbi:MAG TPA: hypothetical protein VFB21_20250, partial [Chthonomonadaceae bacterium]|nr:hypothetical protein [Chthonomonadaceae bacterium]
KSYGSPLSRLGEFLGSQALLLGPALFVGALGAGRWALRPLPPTPLPSVGEGSQRRQPPPLFPSPCSWGEGLGEGGRNAQRLFLLCLGLPVFLFFCLMALKAKVQANWAPCAWLTLTVLWAAWLAERAEQSERTRRKAWGLFALAAATSGLLTVLLLFPALRLGLIRLPPRADTSNTAYGWRQVAARVQQIRREMEQGGRRQVFVAGNGYQYPALMAFYLPDHPETYDMFLHFRLTMYAAYVERLKLRLGQDAVFVNDGKVDDADLRQVFERVEWEPPLPVWRRPLYDRPIRFIYIARCYGYRRYTGLDWARGG